MKRRLFLMGLVCLSSCTLSAATYYTIDTTSPLHCYLSSKFQNRVMIENGRIKKVVATECERLSIQIEELTGQAFIYARDPTAKETSVSVISDTGVIQDVHICFIERMPEVVVLQDPDLIEGQACELLDEQHIENADILKKLEEILAGNIPTGYSACPLTPAKWIPKKGIELELKTIFEGPVDLLYIYQATNLAKQPQTLLECELEYERSEWVYLETTTLHPQQKILSIIAVKKDD